MNSDDLEAIMAAVVRQEIDKCILDGLKEGNPVDSGLAPMTFSDEESKKLFREHWTNLANKGDRLLKEIETKQIMTSDPKVNQDELGKVIRGMQAPVRIDPTINHAEIGKVIRDMQGTPSVRPNFNQAAQDIVDQGAAEKRLK